jgi:hypothetical protein
MPVQTNQIIDNSARTKIGSVAQEQLDNQTVLINDKLDMPLDVTLSGAVLTIEAGTKQKLESDGANATQNSYKWRLPLLSNTSVSPAQSTLNFSSGAITGDFDASAGNGISMTASYYVQLGIELRSDGKFYAIWGTPAASAGAATAPEFSSGALQILIVTLHDDGTGGLWHFITPVKSDIGIIKIGSAGGGSSSSGTSSIGRINYLDSVSSSMPSVDPSTVDGYTIANNDIVLFTNLSTATQNNKVYKATVAGGAISWTLLKLGSDSSGTPAKGDGLFVMSGAQYRDSLWFFLTDKWNEHQLNLGAIRDRDGNILIPLYPPIVEQWVIQDSGLTSWLITIDDSGVLSSTDTGVPDAVTTKFKVTKPDASYAEITINTSGELIVNSPVVSSGLLLNDYFYISSPNGQRWKVTVNNSNEVVTQSVDNTLLVKNDKGKIFFAVYQTSDDMAMLFANVYTATTLPSPAAITGCLPFCFYDNGANKRLIYHDGSSWRYVHDNTGI